MGSEALASGALTRHDLRSRYVKLHRDVYAPIGLELTARDRAFAAWLWSQRRAIMVGTSAAAMLGTRWLPTNEPAEVSRARYSTAAGLVVRADTIAVDEQHLVSCGATCTTPARTAYDLGRRLEGDTAVIRIDALMNATKVSAGQVCAIAERYPGARGLRQLRTTLTLVDGGAESPQETRLRLLLVEAGLPPVTQIPVRNDFGRVVRRIDMGYPEYRVGVEYDGEHHFTGPDDYANDIERLEFLANRGWTIVRVSSRQLRFERGHIVDRVRAALARTAAAQYE